jgi:outer membrane protein
MKNLSLILNGILILAVGALYYFHFSKGSTGGQDSPSTEQTASGGTASGIVYVNIDTLLNNYGYFLELQDDFADRQAEMEAELNNRSRQYEASALDFQNKVQKGLVTRREAAELEQALMQEQQNLLQLRDQLQLELAEEEQVSNRRLINAIMEYLKDYNKDYNYQFVFSNSFGDNVLFADEGLDITRSVLEGLNAKYESEKQPE